MRIALFFQHLPPFPGAGSLRAASIVAGLLSDRRGVEMVVTLFSPTPNAEPRSGVKIVQVPVADVENARGLKVRIWGEAKIGLAAAMQVFRRSREFDILVISTPAYLSALILSSLSRVRGIPYAIELRDVYPQVYAESGLLNKKSVLYGFLSRASQGMYLNAVVTIAATRGLKSQVLADAPAAKVQCVYNGFPCNFADIAASKRPRFTVCFHGVLGYFQNLPGIIELAEILEPYDIDILVIGYGKQAHLAEHCTLTNFIFLGKLSFEQTVQEVSRCHVGLCLRNDDDVSRNAFPVKVWEYLGLAIPSIVTPHCEAGTFLENKKCGFQFQTDEVPLIAQKIRHLRDNPDQMATLVDNCKNQRLNYTRESLGRVAADVIIAAAKNIAGK